MHSRKRKRTMHLTVVGLALALSGNPLLAAEARGATPEGMVFDLIILRPVGLVATAVGGAAYVVSLPFSLAGGNPGQAWQKLVYEPARFTFARPLGELRYRPVDPDAP